MGASAVSTATPLPSRHLFSPVAAFAAAQGAPAPCAARVIYLELPATGIPSVQAAPVLRRVASLSLGHRFAHDSFLVKSFCEYLFRCGRPAVASPWAFTLAVAFGDDIGFRLREKRLRDTA